MDAVVVKKRIYILDTQIHQAGQYLIDARLNQAEICPQSR